MNAYQSPQRQPILLLTRRQRAALVVPAYVGLVALPAYHTRVALCGIRQSCSRSGVWHTVNSSGHADAGCARHNYRVGQK
jgi:hypothetical protein